MNIPDETLDDFIACYQETFPEPLSRDEARDMFKRLVHFYEGLRDYVLSLREDERTRREAYPGDGYALGDG